MAYEAHMEVHPAVLVGAINSGAPHERFQQLAATCPVIHNVDGSVTLTRLADMQELHRMRGICAQGLVAAGVGASHGRLIPLDLDGPEHTRYRKVLDPLFSPKRMLAREAEFFALSNEVIDRFIDDGEAELYAAYCKYAPGIMFLRLMGLPETDVEELLVFNDAQLRTDPALSAAEATDHRNSVTARFYEYLNAVLDEKARLAAPPDDVLGHLLHVEIEGARLTRSDIVDITFLLMIAGLDTVASNLANALVRLADRPDLRRQLMDDPTIWTSAAEELIRFESVVSFSKRASRDAIEIAGEVIPAMTTMYMLWPASNLDESTFHEPLEIDLLRSPNPHIAFGLGKHRCLGSHLARMELRSGLRALLERIPDYRLTEDPDFRTGGNPRSPKMVSIAWDTATDNNRDRTVASLSKGHLE
ncbi:MAG: cytochrome [Acidimicrobiales bacterium]|nr:cytochrome [Acidimicrobiales bacterium]